jgi:hypothetical protein
MDEIVRTVVPGAESVGVIEAGAKRHIAPEGSPPVQANVMVEWKPPAGATVSVTALEFLPCAILIDDVDDDRVKPPTGSRTVSVATGEVLTR